MNNIATANNILSYLQGKPRMYYKTIDMIKALEIPDNTGNRESFRKILFCLAADGKLMRTGDSRFRWRLNCEQWDGDEPYGTFNPSTIREQDVAGSTAPKPERKPPTGDRYADKPIAAGASTMYRVGGKTWENKNTIRNNRGVWNEKGKYWTINEIGKVQLESCLPPLTLTFTPMEGAAGNMIIMDEYTTSPVFSELATSKPTASANLNQQLSQRVELLSKQLTKVTSDYECAQANVKDLLAQIKQRPDKIKIEINGKVTGELQTSILPKQFQLVLDLMSAGEPVFLYGPTGCGKTTIAALAAKTLGKRFGAIPCTEGTSEINLLGRAVPDIKKGANNYEPSEFVDIYREGGVFAFEEIDSCNPNLLLCINTALANGYCPLPNGGKKMRSVTMSPEFNAVATANTLGKGGDRTYCGRNQLDEATLDRFRIGMIECDYDEGIEAMLCPDDELRNRLVKIRKATYVAAPRRVVSTRFLEKAHKMKSTKGWSIQQIVTTLTKGWTTQEIQKCLA